MTGIYYTPEAYGFETVGEISWNDDSYQFDLTAVWLKSDDPGVCYYTDDQGCSCPTPFDYVTDLQDLTRASLTKIREHFDDRAENAQKDVSLDVVKMIETLHALGVR